MTSIVDYQLPSTAQVPREMFSHQTEIILLANYPISYENIPPGTYTGARRSFIRTTMTHFKRRTAQKETYSQGSNCTRATNIPGTYTLHCPSLFCQLSLFHHSLSPKSATPLLRQPSPRSIRQSNTNLNSAFLGWQRSGRGNHPLPGGASTPVGPMSYSTCTLLYQHQYPSTSRPGSPAPEERRVVFLFFWSESVLY